MQPKARRQIGAHYTSERDILKVIRSLFLDELRAEFENRQVDRATGRRERWRNSMTNSAISVFSIRHAVAATSS